MLVGLVLVTAAPLTRVLPADIALPVAAGSSLLLTTTLGLVGASLQTPVLSTWSSPLLLIWVTSTVILTGVQTTRGGRFASRPLAWSRQTTLWRAAAYAPAFLALVAAVFNGISLPVASRWFAIIVDNVNHASAVRAIRTTGVLDYAGDKYPRGLHALLAFSYNAVDAPTDLSDQITAGAAVPWICLALFIACITALTIRTAAARSIAAAVLCTYASVALLLVSPEFVYQFVLYGASPSLLALSLLTVPILLVSIYPPHSRVVLWSIPLIAACLAHLWPALIAAPALAGIVASWRLWAHLRSFRTWLLRMLALLLPSLSAVLLAWPVLHALGQGGGIGAVAALPGRPEIPQLPVILVSAIGIAWLIVRAARRDPLAVTWLSTVFGILLMASILLISSGNPTDLAQWYPIKGAWFIVGLSLPAGPMGIVAGVRSIYTLLQTRAHKFARSIAAVLAACMAFSLLLINGVSVWSMIMWPAISIPFESTRDTRASEENPGGLAPISAAEKSQRTIYTALNYGTKYRPATTVPVAVGYDPIVDKRSSRLTAAFIALETGQITTSGDLASICDQVEAVASDGGSAVVITAIPWETLHTLAADQGCPEVPIHQIDWPVNEANLDVAVEQVRRQKESAR